MRALVTGAGGFVGNHLCAALRARGDEIRMADRGGVGDVYPLDLGDPRALRAMIERAEPAAIYHLAGQASVKDSFADPTATFDVNARGTALLLDAARSVRDAGGPATRIVVVSSADVYGARAPDAYPLRETLAVAPASPYAASKAAAEAVAQAYHHAYGLDVIIVRAFNHIGPGQSERFAIASFAGQLARIARGGKPLLLTGDLSVRRDFLDVRDVAAAYIALAGGGRSGEIYNVASGRAVPLREVLRLLIEAAHVPVEVREDENRMRAADAPVVFGDATKLREETGWSPSIPLAVTLRETYRAALEAIAP